MDMTALIFYACICAVLSFFAPQMGRPWKRLAIGAVVGVAAAALLPVLRDTLAL